jgi:hypothetical protein
MPRVATIYSLMSSFQKKNYKAFQMTYTRKNSNQAIQTTCESNQILNSTGKNSKIVILIYP